MNLNFYKLNETIKHFFHRSSPKPESQHVQFGATPFISNNNNHNQNSHIDNGLHTFKEALARRQRLIFIYFLLLMF